MKAFVLFLVLFCVALADELVITKGEALILELDKKNLQKITLSASNLKQSKVIRAFAHPSKDDKCVALIGISYKNPPQNANLQISYKNKSLKYDIIVNEGTYKKEQLKVASSKIKPPKEVQERIAKELKEANAIYATYTNEALFNGAFVLPMSSKITSEFGNARVFNDTLASYHSGTDFRAAVGTKVYAANDGVVRLSKDRYYAGGSLIIDHGYGIFTQYYHLSKLLVKNGDKVKKGQLIALSGDSGRVTGAHLHFGIFANGTQVNPLDFIEKFNTFFP